MNVKELLSIKDAEQMEQLRAVKKFVKGSDTLGKKKCESIIKKSFKDVQTIKELYSDNKLIELLCFLLSCNSEHVLKQDYKDFIYFMKFVDDELTSLHNLEIMLNQSNDGDELMNMRLEQAGASELNKFGSLNTIDTLAGGDILLWDKVESMPYEMIWTKLMMNKTNASVQRRYQEIVIEENKNK